MDARSIPKPDTSSVIKTQHRNISQLFEQLGDPEAQLEERPRGHRQRGPQHYVLAHEIIGALLAHTEGVQRSLLPVIREKAADGAKLSADSVRDDGEMLSIARRLRTLEGSAPTFTTTVDALRRAFEHHVRREEDLFFPVLRDTLSEKDSRVLGNILRRAEFEVLSHSMAGETLAGDVL